MTKQSKRSGQPVEEESNDVFILLCEWLKIEGEPYSLNEFHDKMIALDGTNDLHTFVDES